MLNFDGLDTHEIYMHRCLQLAELGSGHVAPNPMVGAVLVYDSMIIGEGYHMQYGQAHAEVNCINSVPEASRHLINKSTLYVSLEPCNHFGKTPPCSALIIEQGIPAVVIACKDPFEKVNGTGIQRLKDAGVNIITGVLEKEALEMNRRFFTFHQQQRPYIILKWAQSQDQKIANADRSPVKISNAFSDRLVHQWRSEEAAIMVGTKTALHDDPMLTSRLWPGKDPTRVVIDKNLELPSILQLFDQSVPTIILNYIKQDTDGNNSYDKIPEGEDLVTATMNSLRKRDLTSLIVEGGAMLIQSFIDKGYWDEARVITNEELLIKDGIPAPVLKNTRLLNTEKLLTDEIRYYKPHDQLK